MFASRVAKVEAKTGDGPSRKSSRRSESQAGSKFVIGKANDPREFEADRIADHVTRAPNANPSRKHAACDGAAGNAPTIVHEVLASAGRPLEPSTRAFFEPRFGHDFSRVQIHTERRAAESAKAVDALAYTVGQHIVFAERAFAPETQHGNAVLAHELVHVRQQRDAQSAPLTVQPQDIRAERVAERVADRITQHGNAGKIESSAYGLYRAPAPGAPPRTIPSGRRTIVQWGDDPATTKNTEALRTGARSGPNAAGADRVVHYQELTPDSLAETREVVVVIHGETEVTPEGQRVVEPESGQPKATYGAPGLPHGTQGPVEAVSPEAMAARLVGAGFGEGHWTNYRVRLAMCYAGVGETESYSARLSRALAALGVSNETIGLRGQVTAVGGKPTGTTQPPRAGQSTPKAAEAGEPVAGNFYPVYDGTSFGAPGTRMRRDVNPAQATPKGAPGPPATLGDTSPSEIGGKGIAPKTTPLAGEGFEGKVPVGKPGGTAIGIFQLLLVLGSYLPDPVEELEVKEGLKKALGTSESAARIAELQKQIQKSSGNIYYNIEFRITYEYVSSAAARTVPTVRSVKNVEVTRIDVSPNSVARAGELDQPERPTSATPRYGGGYTWEAHSICVASSQVQSGGQIAEQRARERREQEQRAIADQLRSLAAKSKAPVPAHDRQTPKPPAEPPSLLPAPSAPAPSLLPGAPGAGPLEKAAIWVQRATSAGQSLLARGTGLVGRLGSAHEPSQTEKAAFLDVTKGWMLGVKYQQNWYAENGPDTGVQGLKQLLEDPSQPGPKLKQQQQMLGGE